MENAADALKMAAAILIFIIAIGASFSLFGTAKQTADSIITMRDKQAYLELAELEDILYTTSDSVKSDGTKFTEYGDRIVSVADVFSTIYRYSVESYGVTIIEKNGDNGTVIARFDTATESIIDRWDEEGAISDENKSKYIEQLKKNLKTAYLENINLDFKDIYALENGKVGAPWLGNSENIQERIKVDIDGGELKIGNKKYIGKEILNELNGKTVVEVTNEIDESKYLQDGEQETNLLQQYNMPTVEVIYIVL